MLEGWVWKRLCEIGWSDETMCRGCGKGSGHGETQGVPLSGMERSEESNSRRSEEGGLEADTSMESWLRQRGRMSHPLSNCDWREDYLSIEKVAVEQQSRVLVVLEGFRDHVTEDGSLMRGFVQVVSLWMVGGAIGSCRRQ